jgi:glycerol kinase
MSSAPKPEEGGDMADFVGAIDQGTTSTRFMVFDHDGREIARHQLEHEQILPRSGWIEHDPELLWQRTQEVVTRALGDARLTAADLAAVGITNQRETTVVWDRATGRPVYNAIVWQDTRTGDAVGRLAADGHADHVAETTGLPLATYFAGPKIAWILDHVDGARAAAEAGDLCFGTIDSWLLWKLTGGADGGMHCTDVTNASRTMLMDVRTLSWDQDLLDLLGIPAAMLPQIQPSNSSGGYGVTRADGPFGAEVGLHALLGDQHAATVGQVCFAPGEAKNTYGTGNFLLLNTGEEPVRSEHGLLTTPAYQFEGEKPVYALEGSIAVTGSAIQWLRDQLSFFDDVSESEEMAGRVPSSEGVYFVPAFSGLFAPYWRPDARGAIVGISRFHTKEHIVRATLEAICYQSAEVVAAMEKDSGVHLQVLKVDGGVTANDLCMQIQSDVLGVPVSRPEVAETTALGAAYAAGLAVGFWSGTDELRHNWRESRRWEPAWSDAERSAGRHGWRKAIDRALDWVEPD